MGTSFRVISTHLSAQEVIIFPSSLKAQHMSFLTLYEVMSTLRAAWAGVDVEVVAKVPVGLGTEAFETYGNALAEM